MDSWRSAITDADGSRVIVRGHDLVSLMTGAMFIAECLKQEGVTKVFGQCGHTNYALIDACHRLGIEYISFRHVALLSVALIPENLFYYIS